MSTATVALEHVMDGRSENHRQARLIAALDTPEIDSAIEIAWLIPDKELRDRMLRILAEIHRSNTTEGHSEQQAAGVLDRAARTDHAVRLHQAPAGKRLTVRAAANLLRPLLHRDRDRKPNARWELLRAIDQCVQQMDAAYLTGTGMRGELGAGPHDQLLQRLNELEHNKNDLAGVSREAV